MPCLCGKKSHPELAGAAYHTGLPRTCWLYANDPAYTALWDKSPPPQQPRCPHLWKRVRDPGGKVVRRLCPQG